MGAYQGKNTFSLAGDIETKLVSRNSFHQFIVTYTCMYFLAFYGSNSIELEFKSLLAPMLIFYPGAYLPWGFVPVSTEN